MPSTSTSVGRMRFCRGVDYPGPIVESSADVTLALASVLVIVTVVLHNLAPNSLPEALVRQQLVYRRFDQQLQFDRYDRHDEVV